MATMSGPRRAVVEEDWPAAGKRRRAGAVQLHITRGDHVVVIEKISPALYLVRKEGRKEVRQEGRQAGRQGRWWKTRTKWTTHKTRASSGNALLGGGFQPTRSGTVERAAALVPLF